MPSTKKILVAYDGSPASDAIFTDLRGAGLGPKVEAKVLTVADLWTPPVEAIAGEFSAWYTAPYAAAKLQSRETVKAAKALAEKAANQLRGLFPAWKISPAAYSDTPAEGVLATAEKWRPSLIVLGSKGHTALGSLILGSVTHKVLTHAGCSVRISRSVAAAKTGPRVLLAVDGSKDAQLMLRSIPQRTWPEATEFCVVVIVDYRLSLSQTFAEKKPKGPLHGVPFQGTLADRIAEKAVCDLAENGLHVTSVVREGDPRREILKEVKRFKADSLFLGSRGLSATQRFFLGSVSLSLAERGPCSVEIVRH